MRPSAFGTPEHVVGMLDEYTVTDCRTFDLIPVAQTLDKALLGTGRSGTTSAPPDRRPLMPSARRALPT